MHPETHEEYALARTERKTTKGYKGFTFHTEPNVTLEEDLKRRDLTVNAMAQSNTNELIDPYDGQIDLQKKKYYDIFHLRLQRILCEFYVLRVSHQSSRNSL